MQNPEPAQGQLTPPPVAQNTPATPGYFAAHSASPRQGLQTLPRMMLSPHLVLAGSFVWKHWQPDPVTPHDPAPAHALAPSPHVPWPVTHRPLAQMRNWGSRRNRTRRPCSTPPSRCTCRGSAARCAGSTMSWGCSGCRSATGWPCTSLVRPRRRHPRWQHPGAWSAPRPPSRRARLGASQSLASETRIASHPPVETNASKLAGGAAPSPAAGTRHRH